MQSILERAQTIAETLPYLQRHRGATVVIKYGGAAMSDPDLRREVLKDIVLLRLVGLNPVLVHGGGPEIDEMMARLGMTPAKVAGYRVTDEATMAVVEMVLAGRTNKSIVQAITAIGGKAIGLSGKDGRMIRAARMMPDGQDIGFVGEVAAVDPRVIHDLMRAGYLAVIAPIGEDEDGNSYNINADTAAAAIAGALRAEKLILLTDVPGVLFDVRDPSSLVSSLTMSDAVTLIETGQIEGGMIPKVTACLDAISRGVARCHIIDGRQPHAILVELFTDGGIGTMIVPDEETAEPICGPPTAAAEGGAGGVSDT